MISHKSLILNLVCLLATFSLIRADLQVDLRLFYPQWNSHTTTNTARSLQAQTSICSFYLFNTPMMSLPPPDPYVTTVLDVVGPPYQGTIANLGDASLTNNFFNDLVRFVYLGQKCDCTVTVYQGVNNGGRSKEYTSNGNFGEILVDQCWSERAKSLSIVCQP